MEEIQETTPYDDVFKTQKMECPKLLIPVINEVFQENYKEDTEVINFENEIFLRKLDGYEEKRITDAVLHMKEGMEQRKRSYHIECQSTKDKTMIVRMYEYDSQIALKDREWDGEKLKVKFPYSAIICLRSDDTIGKDIRMILNTPEKEVEYRIPLIRMKDYNLDTIFEKHLFILLPFWMFVHEKQLGNYERDKIKRKELVEEFGAIISRLQNICEKGIIDEYTKCMLIDMSKKVIRNLLGNKYPKVRQEVEKVMGGNVLEFEAKTIKNQGREEGRKEGRQETIRESLKVLITMLKNNNADVEAVYRTVKANELYKEVTYEQIEKYYYME